MPPRYDGYVYMHTHARIQACVCEIEGCAAARHDDCAGGREPFSRKRDEARSGRPCDDRVSQRLHRKNAAAAAAADAFTVSAAASDEPPDLLSSFLER